MPPGSRMAGPHVRQQMTRRIAILAVLPIAALATHGAASELTNSLADKVKESDLVAVIKISGVERGLIHGSDNRHDEAQDFTMTASVIERIKGASSDTIKIHANATFYEKDNGIYSSTAGFSGYGIKPGQSYIAYLRKVGETTYRLSWDSDQLLESISDDGSSVNDIGQTLDQVPLEPKLRTLRSLASGWRFFALITAPISLGIALFLSLLLGILLIRKKRAKLRGQT